MSPVGTTTTDTRTLDEKPPTVNPRTNLQRLRRLVGRGVYPEQFAWLLTTRLRRLVVTPEALADRLELRPADHVLEVGAGPGYFSVEVARRVPEGRLQLVDIQPAMLDRARQRLERAGCTNVAITVADAAHLPFAEAEFDVAFLVTVLGEIEDRAAAVRELRRVLRPNGRLSITEERGDPDYLSPEAVRALVEPAGFVEVSRFKGRWHTTQAFRLVPTAGTVADRP